MLKPVLLTYSTAKISFSGIQTGLFGFIHFICFIQSYLLDVILWNLKCLKSFFSDAGFSWKNIQIFYMIYVDLCIEWHIVFGMSIYT